LVNCAPQDIEKCVELGVSLDVELPELNELKAKHKQSEWLEEAQEVLSEPKGCSFEQMKEVLDAGAALPPHPAVERALGEITGMLSQVGIKSEKVLATTTNIVSPFMAIAIF
jgi:histone demethylase JARID1